jgi:ParB family transcriptional regulator, chromosome partitioning protein
MSDINSEVLNKKKGLGRGLGSLLKTHGSHTLAEVEVIETNSTAHTAPNTNPEATHAAIPVAQNQPAVQPQNTAPKQTTTAPPPLELTSSNQDKMWMLSIEKLRSGKYQPRKHFDKKTLDELAASIKEHGILQPLVVRSVGPGQFEIIAGERRWRAAQAAGLHEVPAIIKTFDNQKTLELSLIENLQREDLNPIEEAEGYQRLMSEFSLTQERVAEKVGKERATVANALRLLRLDPDVRQMVQAGQISQGHAKVLLALPELNQQKELAKVVTESGLSVRKLEELVQKKVTPQKTTDKITDSNASVTTRLIAGLAEEMQKLLGTRVNIDYANAKGKMSIYFYSDDELTQIIEKLRGARN